MTGMYWRPKKYGFQQEDAIILAPDALTNGIFKHYHIAARDSAPSWCGGLVNTRFVRGRCGAVRGRCGAVRGARESNQKR